LFSVNYHLKWHVLIDEQSMPGMGGHNHGGAPGSEGGGIMSGGTGIKNLDFRAVLKGDVTLAMYVPSK
jgi:hypothetical protein